MKIGKSMTRLTVPVASLRKFCGAGVTSKPWAIVPIRLENLDWGFDVWKLRLLGGLVNE
jgi:hypothetical protein